LRRKALLQAFLRHAAAFKLSAVTHFSSDASSSSSASGRQQKLIVLDRDGVINHDSDQFIKSPDEWTPIPGSLEAIARLNQAGYRVVVATNQSGIGRGLFDISMLNAIHNKMHRALAQAGGRIDAVFFCPHSGDSQCECRKPRAGMLQEIGRRFGVDLTGVPALGDSLRDLQAADAVGAQPMLMLTGKGEKTLREGGFPVNTVIFPDLAFAAAALISGDQAR
jgi:D-glycero-D-manno-heptose 1,7-bisphosphate phosphatase